MVLLAGRTGRQPLMPLKPSLSSWLPSSYSTCPSSSSSSSSPSRSRCPTGKFIQQPSLEPVEWGQTRIKIPVHPLAAAHRLHLSLAHLLWGVGKGATRAGQGT